MESQKRVVLDQFTKQASPFASAAAMRDKRALELLLASTSAGVEDTVLDVACGPGSRFARSLKSRDMPRASISCLR
jgi:hypothetical protein